MVRADENLKSKTASLQTRLQDSGIEIVDAFPRWETAAGQIGIKIRVGLFMGGASSEKEISLESARHVYNNLDREKYEVLPVFVDAQRHLWQIEESLLWKNTTTDIVSNLGSGGGRIFYEELKGLIDFAFITLHGKYGEEAFPGLFEILHIPNNGASVLGGALSMDKYRQRKVLMAEGIKVPKHLGIDTRNWKQNAPELIEKVENEFGYPFIVKPSREGSSTALFKVKSAENFENAVEEAFLYDNLILVEEVLEGMELTTTVYGLGEDLRALPPSQLQKRGDYLTAEEKFLPGGARMITPPPLSEEIIRRIQDESVKAFKCLDLKIFSRIDSFWLQDRGVVILEPNNPPAMTPSTALWLQAAEAGMNAGQFLDEIIRISLKAHSEKIGPL